MPWSGNVNLKELSVKNKNKNNRKKHVAWLCKRKKKKKLREIKFNF